MKTSAFDRLCQAHFDRVTAALEAGGNGGLGFCRICLRAGSIPMLVRICLRRWFGMTPRRYVGLYGNKKIGNSSE